MLIPFKNRKLESFIFAVNGIAAAVVIATFVMLFGFRETLIDPQLLYSIQILLVFYFIFEKVVRAINAESKIAFIRVFWFQIPLILLVGTVYFGAETIFSVENPGLVKKGAVGFFLIMQVVFKVGRTIVNTAATGKNPTRTLIGSFVGLILSGTGMLMLPTASTHENHSFVDALFTSTSATCVTGLVVKDTGTDFSLMGQCVILGLIQLGGLGIVIFG